jgi:bifunctional non-homologous end joining protein LigD
MAIDRTGYPVTDLTADQMLETIHRSLEENSASFRRVPIPSRAQLEAYWRAAADRALTYLGNRLLNIVRPSRNGGVDYHRGPLPPIPPEVHQLRIEKSDGTQGVRLWIDDLPGLLGLVEMDVVEVHPWGSTVDDIERPDLLAFNLKPGDAVDWSFVVDTSQRLRGLLAAEDLDCWPKATGDESLHVMVPFSRDLKWEAARDFAKNIAERLQATAPDRYTLSTRINRTGKLLIDYLRNGRGSTVVGAYSPRALPGFPIAAPIGWDDLERGIRSNSFTMTNLPPVRQKPRAQRRRSAHV